MSVGIILAIFGVIQTAWMIWRIRTYAPEPNKIGRVAIVMHDIGRTTPRPKSRFAMAMERYSYWCGLAAGLLIFVFGVAFIISE
jgi:hypothetical protein